MFRSKSSRETMRQMAKRTEKERLDKLKKKEKNRKRPNTIILFVAIFCISSNVICGIVIVNDVVFLLLLSLLSCFSIEVITIPLSFPALSFSSSTY